VKLNGLALTKICKKFDKCAKCDTKSKLVDKKKHRMRSDTICELEKKITSAYAKTFENGDEYKAKVHLTHTLSSGFSNKRKMF